MKELGFAARQQELSQESARDSQLGRVLSHLRRLLSSPKHLGVGGEEHIPESRLGVPYLLIGALLCYSVLPAPAAAQQTSALSVEDALGMRYFGDLSPIEFSPDARWLAYGVRDNRLAEDRDDEAWIRTGVPPWSTGSNIWIQNVETGQAVEVTEAKGDNWLPTWSPDGRYLAFISNRDEDGQARVWLWDAAKNRSRKASDLRVRADEIEWTPDSGKLFVTTLPGGLSPEDYATKLSSGTNGDTHAHREAKGSTVILYRGGWPNDGKPANSDPWNLDHKLRDLASIDVKSGQVSTIVQGKRIATYLISPDGSQIAYTIPRRFEKPGSQQIIFDLVTVALSSGKERVVASDVRLDFGGRFNWSPDGSRLSYRNFGPEERTFDCYVVGLDGENPRNVTMLARQQEWPPHTSKDALWDIDGKSIYFITKGVLWRASLQQGRASEVARIAGRQIVNMIPGSDNVLWTLDDGKSTIVMTHDDVGKQDGFYKINLGSGDNTKLLEKGQCYTCVNVNLPLAVAKDRQRIAYLSEDARHSADLWTSDDGFLSTRQLTHLNPQFEKYKMGATRLVKWLSEDGEPLEGALLLPTDYQEGQRYPLIVYVYGGFSLSDCLDQFGLVGPGPFNMQLFSTRGYAVLLPDAPQHLGTPMRDLAKTVLPGVSRVIEMGIADPDRLGVMGHSYGGYSTLALIVQTTQFKAAVEADGYGDLIGHYGEMREDGTAFGTSIEEEAQGLIGASPWQLPVRYIENSPIFYLDRVQTPLLIAHGSEDNVVAPFLADEIFVGLRRLGKKVEYAKYAREGHSPPYWNHADQVDFCNRLIAWFDTHLRKQPKN